MRSFLVLVFLAIIASLFAEDDGLALDRMPRTAPGSAWLVPYPRVGKRSSPSNDESHQEQMSAEKRLYLARVGKRAYMYAARVGK